MTMGHNHPLRNEYDRGIFLHMKTVNVVPRMSVLTAVVLIGILSMSAQSEEGVTETVERFRETCQPQPIRMRIHPPAQHVERCLSTTILTVGCRGKCRSYSKPSPENPNQTNRFCSCCQPTRFGVPQIATMHCLDGTQLRTPVRFTLECHCRPCNTPLGITDLQQMLQENAQRSQFLP